VDILNLIGLVANVVFFIVNLVLYFKQRREERATENISASETRIERVVAHYVRLSTVHPIQDSGIHALIVSGVKDLASTDEISEALRRIVDRTGSHPLGRDASRVPTAALKNFYSGISVRTNETIGYQEALAKYGTPSR
jgi:hypothetical protein